MNTIVRLVESLIFRIISLFCPLKIQAKLVGVKIGKHCFVKSHFWSTEPYLITIGDNCQITLGVSIYTHGGSHVARIKCPNFDVFGKVVVGNNVYIGNYSLIMPGVSIGDNVLIGAGSVVTKSIPSNCVVAGNPAKYICSIDEYIERNETFNVGSKGYSSKKKKDFLLSLTDEKFIKKSMMKVKN